MKKFSIISRKKNEKKTETSIREDMEQLIESEKELEKSREFFRSELLKKISSLEERTKRLDELEKSIEGLKSLLVDDKEKDAKVIFEFISKSPKRKLEKIAILAGIARSIPEPQEIKIPPESVITHADIIDIKEIGNRLNWIEGRLEGSKRCLFSVDADIRLEEDLNNGVIPKDLQDEFTKREFLSFDNAPIPVTEETENEWIIADKFCIRRENGQLNVYFYIEETKREIEEMDLFSALAMVISELNALREGFPFLNPRAKEKLREMIKREISSLGSGTIASESDSHIQREEIYVDEVHIPAIHKETKALFQEGVKLLEGGEGVKLFKKGKNKKAYDKFNEIIKKNSNLKGAWLNKGVASGRLGKTGEEIYCYIEALGIDRGYDKAIHNLESIR